MAEKSEKADFETFQLFSSSSSDDNSQFRFGFLDSSETSLPPPPPPPPPCVEVPLTEVSVLFIINFFLIFVCLWKFFLVNLISYGLFSCQIGFVLCEVHCRACEFEWIYFAEGSFFLSFASFCFPRKLRNRKVEDFDSYDL